MVVRASSVEVEEQGRRHVDPDETYARNALTNATRKIDALSQQAEVVEELKKHMAAQDTLVARLTADLETACEAKVRATWMCAGLIDWRRQRRCLRYCMLCLYCYLSVDVPPSVTLCM